MKISTLPQAASLQTVPVVNKASFNGATSIELWNSGYGWSNLNTAKSLNNEIEINFLKLCETVFHLYLFLVIALKFGWTKTRITRRFIARRFVPRKRFVSPAITLYQNGLIIWFCTFNTHWALVSTCWLSITVPPHL